MAIEQYNNSVIPEFHRHCTPNMIVNSGEFGSLADYPVITVADENPNNIRKVDIQWYRADKKVCDYPVPFFITMCTPAGLTAMAATGGSTGMEVILTGLLLPLVAKKLFFACSDSAGLWSGQWTDTATESAQLCVTLPGGGYRWYSAAFANT